MLSLRDTAFALDGPGSWSLRASVAVPTWPTVLPGNGTISVRKLASRFSGAGTALRSLSNGTINVWDHVSRATVVKELRDRLRDPAIIVQDPTGLCGPISIVVELARRAPVRYVLAAKELLETGQFTCPTGRVICAEEELREAPIPSSPPDPSGGTVVDIGQVDWLLAATMRDCANVWEDVDTGTGLEVITLWDTQRYWARDVLDLPFGGWETCFSSGEIDCMKKAQNAVKAGGVAFFLVDSFLLRDGGDDDEEEMWWRRLQHAARTVPFQFKDKEENDKFHSEDDAFPPDHWVIYLGGLHLGDDPGDDDPVAIRLWSWGREYEVTGTVDAFTEYLWGVVTGYH